MADFNRTILRLLQGEVQGPRIVDTAQSIIETDRWNSFDRFHETAKTIAKGYEAANAVTETYSIQTGGRIGSGRWVVQEAADIHGAKVDVIAPVHKRVVDYAQNPWHVIQWTAGTSREGLQADLVPVDSVEELDRTPSESLRGRIILTRLDPRNYVQLLAAKGVVGVITDRAVANQPDALAWTKFGWGGIPIENAAAHLVGLVLSENQGQQLRALLLQYGRLTLQVKVDVRGYVGSFDLVSGIIQGRDDPQDEVWALAHSAEPGAIDNASGVAVCIEAARLMQGLVDRGLLPRPRRSIRFLHGYECYSFFDYLENAQRFQLPLAGICVDSVGAKPEVCAGRLAWRATVPMSASFVNRVGEAILRAALRLHGPIYRLSVGPFVSTSDTLIGDPQYGFPCPWPTTCYQGRGYYDAYHSSADTVGLLSPEGLSVCATAVAGYLYYLADAGAEDVIEMAEAETRRTLRSLQRLPPQNSFVEATYIRDQHHVSIQRLQRWLWRGERSNTRALLSNCESRVREALDGIGRAHPRMPSPPAPIPVRLAALCPSLENTPAPIAGRLKKTELPPWGLYWADGERDLQEIAEAIACELRQKVTLEQVTAFFEAQADLGYVKLVQSHEMLPKRSTDPSVSPPPAPSGAYAG